MSISSTANAIESEIATTFRKHYDYYDRIGNETRVQQLKDEQSIKLQYGGRATFELLQNAFDRAERHVLIAAHRAREWPGQAGCRKRWTVGRV